MVVDQSLEVNFLIKKQTERKRTKLQSQKKLKKGKEMHWVYELVSSEFITQ